MVTEFFLQEKLPEESNDDDQLTEAGKALNDKMDVTVQADGVDHDVYIYIYICCSWIIQN